MTPQIDSTAPHFATPHSQCRRPEDFRLRCGVLGRFGDDLAVDELVRVRPPAARNAGLPEERVVMITIYHLRIVQYQDGIRQNLEIG